MSSPERAQKIAALILVAMMAVIAVSALSIHRRFSVVADDDAEVSRLLPAKGGSSEAQLKRVGDLQRDFGFAKLYGDKPCFRFKQEQTVALFIENGCFDRPFKDRQTVFLLGDSHAASLSLGLAPALAAKQINFPRVTYGYCEPTDDRKDRICDEINALALAKIEEMKPDVLVVDSHWLAAAVAPYFNGRDYGSKLISFLELARSKGVKHIIVVGQMPTYEPSLPQRLLVDYASNNSSIPPRTTSAQAASLDMDARMRALNFPDNVTYLSLREALCNSTGCITTVGPDIASDILLWDYGHMTVNGSKFVADAVLMPIIEQTISRR